MQREERKKRLEEILSERKKNEEKLESERRIAEMFELFPDKNKLEILDEKESDKVETEMTESFPIASWGRIDWEKVKNKVVLTKEETLTIPTILSKQSLDTSIPVYLIVGLYKYPVAMTSLFTILENIEDIMDMGPDQWIYSPSLRYVVEFSRYDEITIGWV